MFKPRKILKPLERFLGKREIIVVHGARQTGKTTLLKIIMEKLIKEKNIPKGNIFYFDLEDFDLLEMFNKGHREVIAYVQSRTGEFKKARKIYLLIDEIQYLSHPSSLLKILHDHYAWLQLIVSGSSSFQIKSKFRDSLVGRTVEFELFPLDFEEFLVFKGESFNLYGRAFESTFANKEVSRLFKEYLIYGGYPRVVLEDSVEAKTIYLKQVIDTYIKKDIRDLGHIRDVERFNKLLRVLADKTGSLVNILELSNTVGISRKTIEDYLFIMENTYVIKLLCPFFSNLRSEISKMPKIFFEDTGVANLLKYGFFIEKIEGGLFENAVYCLLRSLLGREPIKYWRTKQKSEIDFVADLPRQKVPIEAKISYPQKSAANLLSFLDRYRGRQAWVISLEKSAFVSKDKRLKCLYPWELYVQKGGVRC